MNSIIQWNCGGIRANFIDFSIMMYKYNTIVCCIQESMLTKDDFVICESKINIVLLSCLINQPPTPFIICGDILMVIITWGCDKNNSQGDRIDDFITDNNICLLNDGSCTYLHQATGTFTSIDLSLCSPDIRMEIDFMVKSDIYGSDHFPIILEIAVSLSDVLPRWNLNCAHWVQFDNLCKAN